MWVEITDKHRKYCLNLGELNYINSPVEATDGWYLIIAYHTLDFNSEQEAYRAYEKLKKLLEVKEL